MATDSSTGAGTSPPSPASASSAKEAEEDPNSWDDHRSYMQVKRRKLREQYLSLGERQSNIFAGATIYVNGYTQPEADELKRMVQAHGGGYEYMPYSSRITHVIATNLPAAKIRRLSERSTTVCTPAWIVDSVRAGEQLPVERYKLYNIASKGQQQLRFGAVVKEDAAETGVAVEFCKDELEDEEMEEEDTLQDQPMTAPHSLSSRSAEFVSEFYSHSRLHYLSTWGTELKQFTSRMLPQAVQKIPRLPPSSSLKAQNSRAVVHVDVDCFFVQVSIMDKPHLKGKPVAVTHAKKNTAAIPPPPLPPAAAAAAEAISDDLASTAEDVQSPTVVTSTETSPALSGHLLHSTSDVASCSYEARQCGVKNGMSVGEALKRCPNLFLVPYDFDKYREVSQILYETLMSYSHMVEAVSCDEAYMELTDYAGDYDSVEGIVRQVRAELEGKTGCTVSAGISHNMLLARMATRKAKPNGQYYLPMGEAQSYLAEQPVADLPGVGWSLRHRLESMDISTCGDLQKIPLAKLRADFGDKTGEMLYNSCRGESDRQLKLVSERKSISVDINFGIRFTQLSEAQDLITQLAQELQKRATDASVHGSCVTLKMKVRKATAPVQTRKYLGHGACDNVSRSSSLGFPTRSAEEIGRVAVRLLKSINPVASDIRGMGLQLTKLASGDSPSKKTARGTADIRSLFSAQHSLSHQPQIISSAKVKSERVGDEHQEADSVHPDLAADYSGGLDLPPASQLDYDVLLELPANLQDKILESYTKRANQSLPSSHSVDSGVVPIMKTDPALDSSRMVTAGEPDEDCLSESASTTNSGRILIEDQEKFVAEMKEKIRHWIATSPNGPDSHDLDTFSNFLVALCPQNMEVTELALKCFRRSATHQGMAVWYPVFNSVLARVQGVMSRCYSGVLAIDPIAL